MDILTLALAKKMGGGGSTADDISYNSAVNYEDGTIGKEVKDLSEEIDNIESFVVTLLTEQSTTMYGHTFFPADKTYDEILAAYNSGKDILFKGNLNVGGVDAKGNFSGFSIIPDTKNILVFMSFTNQTDNNATQYQLVYEDSLQLWTLMSSELQSTSYQVTSLDANSTDTQYPTAKAVYDAIESSKYFEVSIDMTNPITRGNFTYYPADKTYAEINEADNAGKLIIVFQSANSMKFSNAAIIRQDDSGHVIYTVLFSGNTGISEFTLLPPEYSSEQTRNCWRISSHRMEWSTNKVTSISSSSTDTQYPSAKAVYTAISGKQDALTFDATPTEDSTNPVTSGGVYDAVESSKYFEVTIDYSNPIVSEINTFYHADKTFDEIEAAYNAGKLIVVSKEVSMSNTSVHLRTAEVVRQESNGGSMYQALFFSDSIQSFLLFPPAIWPEEFANCWTEVSYELEFANNKVTSLSSSNTDTQYPSAKCVYDLIGDIETLLANI